jgi:propionyl-CoA carboxylase alpha subunit
MFTKILIANRGEIACRIIKTARAMGIKTVAVFSEADADAKHVDLADESVLIGLPPAAQSYLLAGKIIEAAKATGAEAIHPGYGFLSEKAAFVNAVEAAGLVFIGPTAAAIAAMGDKIESKKLAAKAGVSTVPGHVGVIESPHEAVKIAREIGFPVMIKAAGGGGGKGMRIARSAKEVEEGFRSAQNEARSSFADERVFIEKFIEQPRHIEIQVLGDAFGNVIHLGERECSIQRRHQKVIEEAPSPFLDRKMRAAMGAQAVALAKAVGYRSAGTVEFIVDKKKRFYFLEMNTRLQVEHPVTEEVTGLDLVEQMIRIAAGEKLKLKQKDVKLKGSAIEARIYAEDPYRNFLPSIGRLSRYLPPAGEGVRVDDGVYEGSEISIYYDPMVAKLVTFAGTRAKGIARMSEALDRYYIRGIGHNVNFLAAVMRSPRFQSGKYSTGFIAEEFPKGFSGAAMTPAIRWTLLAVAAFAHAKAEDCRAFVSAKKPVGCVLQRVVVLDGTETEAAIEVAGARGRLWLGRKNLSLASPWQPGEPVFIGKVGTGRVAVELDRIPMGYRLATRGVVRDVLVLSPLQAEVFHRMPEVAPPDTSKLVKCPMPGLVVSLAVKNGDAVEAGQTLAVVEAMKMENVLKAEKNGIVKKIHVKAGDSLAVDAVILEFA